MKKSTTLILTVAIIVFTFATLILWKYIITTEVKTTLDNKLDNDIEKISQKSDTVTIPSDIFSDNFYPDDWDWDLGQDCYGLTTPDECGKINWPMNCKNCGCRTADIISCQQCIANKNSDPEMCENIISEDEVVEDFWQDNCYWGLVIKFRDKGRTDKIYFCDRFFESGHKEACYEIIK